MRCPTWHEFLKRTTDGDNDLQRYLQRVAGYALTGDTSEHALFFAYGVGANGKSTFLNAVSGMIGTITRQRQSKLSPRARAIVTRPI